MEKVLAERLLDISQKTHEDCGIKTYHVPCLPRRIYIEAPGILEIQEFMKFSAYGHLVSRATRILDDTNRNFLHGTSVPNVPCPESWVRIKQAGKYKGDLALILYTPSEGDIVTIAVVPRFNALQTKKRKGKRPVSAPALLDPKILAKFPPNEKNIHLIGPRMFHTNGLELLRTLSTHALRIEPRPSEAELFLFQSCLRLLNDETEDVIRRAVNKAFRSDSRRLWHKGDRVKILEGAFVDTTCYIYEIDDLNQSATVEFGSPEPTLVEVSMEDLERQFRVGDQVRAALGKDKGRTGSILEITDGVGTIVEGTALQATEVTSSSILCSFNNYFAQLEVLLLYLESYTVGPSFVATPYPMASSISEPKLSREFEAVKGHQTVRGGSFDPRIGKEAAVYIGPLKGYRGRLREIGANFGKIECPGRQLPIYTALLKHLVLM